MDFKALVNNARREKEPNTVRTIYKIHIEKKNERIFIHVIGNGFLYKMVRNIVGTLLDIATKKRTIAEMESLFSAK